MIVNVDWTQLDKAQTSAEAAATDSRMCKDTTKSHEGLDVSANGRGASSN